MQTSAVRNGIAAGQARRAAPHASPCGAARRNQALSRFHHGAHAARAHTHLDRLAVSGYNRCLLHIGAPHAVGSPLGEADIVPKGRLFSTPFTRSHGS